MVKTEVVQVWQCPRCPDESYESPVIVKGVACKVCVRAAKSMASPSSYNMKLVKIRSRNGRLVEV